MRKQGLEKSYYLLMTVIYKLTGTVISRGEEFFYFFPSLITREFLGNGLIIEYSVMSSQEDVLSILVGSSLLLWKLLQR